MREYTPNTAEIRGQACRLGGWREDAFDRWLAGVWLEAYRAGWGDTDYLDTPNPYEPEL